MRAPPAQIDHARVKSAMHGDGAAVLRAIAKLPIISSRDRDVLPAVPAIEIAKRAGFAPVGGR